MTLLALSLSLLVAIVHAAELHNTDLEDLPAVRRQLAAVIPTAEGEGLDSAFNCGGSRQKITRELRYLHTHALSVQSTELTHSSQFKTGRAMMKASKAMQQTLLSARKLSNPFSCAARQPCDVRQSLSPDISEAGVDAGEGQCDHAKSTEVASASVLRMH
eukprot:462835-Rhodomonas_salina.1